MIGDATIEGQPYFRLPNASLVHMRCDEFERAVFGLDRGKSSAYFSPYEFLKLRKGSS